MAKKSGKGRALTLLGLMAGAAVGAAVALIYSPHNGKGNRRELNQWAHNRLEAAQHKVKEDDGVVSCQLSVDGRKTMDNRIMLTTDN